jgi:hypothetical protein
MQSELGTLTTSKKLSFVLVLSWSVVFFVFFIPIVITFYGMKEGSRKKIKWGKLRKRREREKQKYE